MMISENDIFIEYIFSGERVLFKSRNIQIKSSIFEDGKSPLKHSCDVTLESCEFKTEYPLWFGNNIKGSGLLFVRDSKNGFHYANDISITDSQIDTAGNFNRCKKVLLDGVTFADAKQTLWSCENVSLTHVFAYGSYFCMNSEGVTASNIKVYGDHFFDGVKSAVISDSSIVSDFAFLNTEDVTVKNSFISGKCLGWNSKNLTLENCTVESRNGFCYAENLNIKKCRLINTSFAFEYSSINVDIDGRIDSIYNPKEGFVTANSIGWLILEKNMIDPSKTHIVCPKIEQFSDKMIFDI